MINFQYILQEIPNGADPEAEWVEGVPVVCLWGGLIWLRVRPLM